MGAFYHSRVEWLYEPRKWTEVGTSLLTGFVCDHFEGPKWILVTGGEPCLYNLQPLVNSLQERGYQVALETSGTEAIRGDFDWICVSPKVGMPGGKVVLPEAIERADEIKMVVGRQDDITTLEGLLGWSNGAEICLQPVSQSEKATQLCIDEVIKRGWRLSLQMHKYIGVK
jgi:7-carboxy-7-deazaguanine synthase